MSLPMLMLSVGLLILLCAYIRYSRVQMRQLKNNLQDQVLALHQLQTVEQQLRNEVNSLQTKLQVSSDDAITNLAGWPLFETRLKQAIKDSERYQFNMGILYIDIDDFKVINDAISHEMGDILLKEMAKRLHTCVRQIDNIGRISKDTFVMTLNQIAKPEAAAIVAQRILQALSQPFNLQGNELTITACIGISVYPTDGQDAATLLRCAEHALHLAKKRGKHLYQFFQESMYSKTQRELVLYTALNREEMFQQFSLRYQVVMDIKRQTPLLLEAEIYWKHEELGVITAEELLNFADKQRKTTAVIEWLIRNACQQFLHWVNNGLEVQYIGVKINIKQIENSQFIYKISNILQELNFNPQQLLLVIDSYNTTIAHEALKKSFNMLNYLGIKIALDNFALGSFPLYELKNITANYIKLNNALIQDITTNTQTVALTESILFLAKTLQMEVIVCDITTKEQYTKVKDLGCNLLQGSFLAQPLSDDLVEQLLQTKVTE